MKKSNKSTEIKEQDAPRFLKKGTKEEAVERLWWAFADNPERVMNDFIATFLENRKEKVEENDAVLKYHNALMTFGLETCYPLAQTTAPAYRGFIVNLTKEIELEFKCITASEKMLAQNIASAYVRGMQFTEKLNNFLLGDQLSHERNGYYALISKEIDRAQRHYLNNLMALKQLKTPPIELNIKTNTAFISQNQQINTI